MSYQVYRIFKHLEVFNIILFSFSLLLCSFSGRCLYLPPPPNCSFFAFSLVAYFWHDHSRNVYISLTFSVFLLSFAFPSTLSLELVKNLDSRYKMVVCYLFMYYFCNSNQWFSMLIHFCTQALFSILIKYFIVLFFINNNEKPILAQTSLNMWILLLLWKAGLLCLVKIRIFLNFFFKNCVNCT